MTYIIIAHHPHDAALAKFTTAMGKFCRDGDSIERVDENVIAPKGGPDAVYLGRFSAFDRAAFVKLVQSIPWEFPRGVTTFVKASEQTRFDPIDLQMQYDIGRYLKLAAPWGWGFNVPHQQAEFLNVTYPKLLEPRLALIEDSTRNPHRFFAGYKLLTSISTPNRWLFECVDIRPEQRHTSGHRHEYGPRKDDWTWVKTEHCSIYATLAVKGIHVQFMCDVAKIDSEIFDKVRTVATLVSSGDRVWVDGVLDIRNDGTCIFEKIRSFAKATDSDERRTSVG